jgi:hypothetical protein
MISDITELKQYITAGLLSKGTPEKIVEESISFAIDTIWTKLYLPLLPSEVYLEAGRRGLKILNFPLDNAVADMAINSAF